MFLALVRVACFLKDFAALFLLTFERNFMIFFPLFSKGCLRWCHLAQLHQVYIYCARCLRDAQVVVPVAGFDPAAGWVER